MKVKLKTFVFYCKIAKKKRKTVYGKNFCKPFSKTKTRESLDPFHFTPLCSLSFSLSALFSLLSSHSPNLSHPVSHTPPESPQPEPPSALLGLSLALADRRSPQCPPICRQSARTRVTPTRATLNPSWSLSRTRRSPISTVPTDLLVLNLRSIGLL